MDVLQQYTRYAPYTRYPKRPSSSSQQPSQVEIATRVNRHKRLPPIMTEQKRAHFRSRAKMYNVREHARRYTPPRKDTRGAENNLKTKTTETARWQARSTHTGKKHGNMSTLYVPRCQQTVGTCNNKMNSLRRTRQPHTQTKVRGKKRTIIANEINTQHNKYSPARKTTNSSTPWSTIQQIETSVAQMQTNLWCK